MPEPTPAALPPRASLVEQAYSRVTGSRSRGGNAVRLLRDAAENYPAWLEAIRQARRTVHFENYIVADDAVGRLFAEALAERARAGVAVRFLHDWWGSFGEATAGYWAGLRAAGVEVRAFNPPRLSSPVAWVSRNHRKTLAVDGEVGFVSGLCVAQDWAGFPDRGIPPWRDTGVELRGPVVADLDAAFAEVWALAGGSPLPPAGDAPPAAAADGAEVRVIRGRPGQLGAYRLDQLVAAGAQKRLWLTDAYFVATTPYVRALVEADRDGVDVRLLLPGSSDVPVAQMLARAGYRPLLEAGIRIWEWEGPMLHAKTAVCDGRWARVGSTNLNPTSWLTNWELDVTVEDPRFAEAMEAAYLEDLGKATEVVLEGRRMRGHPVSPLPHARRARAGSGGRFAAGAISLGSAAGAALSGSRPLGGTEAGAVGPIGAVALALAVALAFLPGLLAYPLAALLAWCGVGLLARAWKLRREGAGDAAGGGAAPSPGRDVSP